MSIIPNMTLCSPIRSRRSGRFLTMVLLPVTALMYIVRQGLMGIVLCLSKLWNMSHDGHSQKGVGTVLNNDTPPADVYGPLPAWQMADIEATGHKRNPIYNGGDGYGLKGIMAVLVLVFAVACDDFVRFEAERFICDPNNGLGLQEAELIGKSKSGKMRLTFADGQVQEVNSTVTENHYMVKTTDFRAKIDRKSGQVSGKRGAYSTSFNCNVHSFRM